jgi:hypothetical protein
VPAPCNAPQVEALQPGSRNCDVILYSTSVPSSTPCTVRASSLDMSALR